MNEMPTTIPRPTDKPCRCGCASCKGECCELECLVQPRFFCGQLLTDQDLSALLDWTKAKTALSRYRDGWGVVCGLDVDCHHEPGMGGSVLVTPGYAVDCCGNDVIVCRETSIDLSSYCPREPGLCSDWPPRKDRGVNDKGTVRFGAWDVPKSEVFAVDLLIRYAESLSDARTGLARGGCDATAACEYTRTHEGNELYAVCADDCEDPTEQRAKEWYEAYLEGLRKLFDALDTLYLANDADRTLERLLTWLKGQAPHRFCFVREWLCDLQRADNRPETWFNEAVFWIVQDWRSHYFQCACFGCGPDTGVPLARVWLWRRSRERSIVIYITPYLPFRRPIAPDCWPAPAGFINLAPFIWQRAEDASVPLRKLGFGDLAFQRLSNRDRAVLRERFVHDKLFVPCGDSSVHARMIAHYVEDYCGHRRIVSFTTSTKLAMSEPLVAEPQTLPPDHPSLDIRRVDGIGDGYARRLRDSGIHNLVELSQATPRDVRAALLDVPNPPDDARARKFIDEAGQLVHNVTTEV